MFALTLLTPANCPAFASSSPAIAAQNSLFLYNCPSVPSVGVNLPPELVFPDLTSIGLPLTWMSPLAPVSEMSGLSIASANSPGPLFACKNAGSRNNVSKILHKYYKIITIRF